MMDKHGWQPIETEPKDGTAHIRGLWVYNAHTGEALYWQADIGYIDDDGDFVGASDDGFGWRADDYTHWMPQPEPPDDD